MVQRSYVPAMSRRQGDGCGACSHGRVSSGKGQVEDGQFARDHTPTHVALQLLVEGYAATTFAAIHDSRNLRNAAQLH
jgi:hypothetical protein